MPGNNKRHLFFLYWCEPSLTPWTFLTTRDHLRWLVAQDPSFVSKPLSPKKNAPCLRKRNIRRQRKRSAPVKTLLRVSGPSRIKAESKAESRWNYLNRHLLSLSTCYSPDHRQSWTFRGHLLIDVALRRTPPTLHCCFALHVSGSHLTYALQTPCIIGLHFRPHLYYILF